MTTRCLRGDEAGTKGIHSWKLTWKPKKGPLKTTVPLKGDYMGFHASFQECIGIIWGVHVKMEKKMEIII